MSAGRWSHVALQLAAIRQSAWGGYQVPTALSLSKLGCVTCGLMVLTQSAAAVPPTNQPTDGAPSASPLRSRFGHSSTDVIEVLGEDVGRLMPTVNVVFFGLVGASLKLVRGRHLGQRHSGRCARLSG